MVVGALSAGPKAHARARPREGGAVRRQVSVLLAAAALLAASCEDSRPKGGAITIARVVVTNISNSRL